LSTTEWSSRDLSRQHTAGGPSRQTKNDTEAHGRERNADTHTQTQRHRDRERGGGGQVDIRRYHSCHV